MKKKQEKNKKIAATRKATKERRAGMIVKTFEVKVQGNKLKKETKDTLALMFLETKWLYNHLVAQDDYKTVDDKISEVPVLVKDKYEMRELANISAQMKQSIIARYAGSVKGLGVLKEHGHDVGKLKFKSYVNSIPLKQHGATFEILNDRYIRVEKIKQKLPVNGLLQFILENQYEIACAKLIQKAGDYFLHITVYFDPEHYGERMRKPKPGSHVGIDFGISSAMTLSTGVKIDFNIQPSEKLKKEQRKFSHLVVTGKKRAEELKKKEKKQLSAEKKAKKKLAKAKEKSKQSEKDAEKFKKVKEKEKVRKAEVAAELEVSKNHNKRKNYYKQLDKVRKEQEHIKNQKRDVKNKLVRNLNENFELISSQNENFQGWANWFGKKINNTGMGGIRADLKKKAATHSEIERFYPTTQECCECDHRQKVALDERIIKCNNCDFKIDRDLRSAIKIDDLGTHIALNGYIPVECRRMPVGDNAAAALVDDLNRIPHVRASLVAELGSRAYL